MSLKKAICTHCYSKKSGRSRVFEVNPEVSVCYCPYCERKLDPEDAIDAYNQMMRKQGIVAYKILYEQTNCALAYQTFAQIIELDPSYIEARFGRILSLIYLSGLRRTRFADAILLLKEEAKIYFHKIKDSNRYLRFLRRANEAVDEYNARFRKRLVIHGYYYDDECIKSMYQHVKEIVEFKISLLEECEFMNGKIEDDNFKDLTKKIKEQITFIENELSTPVMSVDGYTYALAGFKECGAAFLGHSTDKQDVKVKKYRKMSLGNHDKKTALIKDQVFHDNTRIARFVSAAIPIEIFLTAAIVTCEVVASFHQDSMIDLFLYLGMVALIFILVGVIIFQVYGYLRIKKKKNLII